MKVLGGLVALGLGAAIFVGGYLGGWWLQGDITNRQMHINRENYGTQLAYITKLESTITDDNTIKLQLDNPNISAQQKTDLSNQRIAIITQGCTTAHLITDVPTADQAWVFTNC